MLTLVLFILLIRQSLEYKEDNTLCLTSRNKIIHIESPGFDKPYPPDVEIRWIVVAHQALRSCLSFELSYVELNQGDYIDVFDGIQVGVSNNHQRRISTNSASSLQPVISSRNVLMVIFSSSSTSDHKAQGFQGRITITQNCSENSLDTNYVKSFCFRQSTVVTLLRRPGLPVDTLQSWLFVSPSDKCISSNLIELNIKDDPKCRQGRLELFDGSRFRRNPPFLAACGDQSALGNHSSVTTSLNSVLIRLRSLSHADSGKYVFRLRLSTSPCPNPLRCRKPLLLDKSRQHSEPACGFPSCQPNETGRLPTHLDMDSMSPRIYQIVDHSWPWLVEIMFCPQPQLCIHICGGSLISPRHIISAAHCFKHSGNVYKYRLRLGLESERLEFNASTPQPGEQRPVLSSISIHPAYGKLRQFDSDIAVLRLALPVKITKQVKPVCLPWDISLPASGSVCYMAGFGSFGEHFHQIALPILSNFQCKQRLPAQSKDEITNNMMCAGYERGVHDSCNGDSGGPLMCKLGKHGTWTLDGIVSFGPTRCASLNQSGIYVRVARYLDFIKNIAFDLP